MNYKGQVAVVTGAGGGLGRAYALELARRGASVVVNDLGGLKSGEGPVSHSAADAVVNEIRAFGGTAVADYNSVTDGEKIIETAILNFKRIDVLINNAGILRDVTLAKMNQSDWDLIFNVHVNGTFKCTKAAWKHFVAQKFGRIVNVTSIAGICGNVGQANYAAAKAAIIGFTKSIAKEGARFNINANVIVPMASSRLTEKLLPDDIKKFTAPEYVAPIVSYLCHANCTDSGEVIEVAAGWIAKLRYQRAKGIFLTPPFTAEQVQSNWRNTGDYSESDYPQEIHETIMICMKQAAENSANSKL